MAVFNSLTYNPTVAEYTTLTNNLPSHTFDLIYLKNNMTTGYYFLNVTVPNLYPKGSLIELWLNDYSTVAINTYPGHIYGDYDWRTYSFIDTQDKLWAAYFKIYTEPAEPTIHFTKVYNTIGVYNLTASSTCNGTAINTQVQLNITGKT